MNRDEVILLAKELIKKDKKRMLHISLDTNRFYNGEIVSFGQSTLSIFDRKLGYMEVLYSQILNIEPYIER